jgi:hypothetical protein
MIFFKYNKQDTSMKKKLNDHYLHGTNPFFISIIFFISFINDYISYKLSNKNS